MCRTVLAVTSSERSAPKKVSFYIDPVLDERMRAAMLSTMVVEGHRSLSDFLSNAVLYEIARLEARYNSGEPFLVSRPSSVPRGRPAGSRSHARDADG